MTEFREDVVKSKDLEVEITEDIFYSYLKEKGIIKESTNYQEEEE